MGASCRIFFRRSLFFLFYFLVLIWRQLVARYSSSSIFLFLFGDS
jgi:hypothetical protein